MIPRVRKGFPSLLCTYHMCCKRCVYKVGACKLHVEYVREWARRGWVYDSVVDAWLRPPLDTRVPRAKVSL